MENGLEIVGGRESKECFVYFKEIGFYFFEIRKSIRKIIIILWNIFVFFVDGMKIVEMLR